MATKQKTEVIEPDEVTPEKEEKSLALRAGDEGVLLPEDVQDMQRLFDVGFQTERVFKIGDPEMGGTPIYFGEIIGPGPDVETKTPDGKKSSLHTWLWYPVNVKTLEPNRRILDQIISGHQMHAKSLKLHTLAKEQGGRGQALVRWEGIRRIHGGKQTLNEVEFTPRVVKA